jgi:hypothetical protein
VRLVITMFRLGGMYWPPVKKVWHWLPARVFTGQMPVPHRQAAISNSLQVPNWPLNRRSDTPLDPMIAVWLDVSYCKE